MPPRSNAKEPKPEDRFNKTLFLKHYAESLSAKDACAKIGKPYSRYAYYIDRDIEFKKAVERIQATIVAKALDNIAKAIADYDIETSKWLLQRLDSRFKSDKIITLRTEPTFLLDGIIEQTKDETK